MDLTRMAPFELGDLIVIPAERLIIGSVGRFDLPPLRMKALVMLARHAPDAVASDELLTELWSSSASDQSLLNAISDLRKALALAGASEDIIESGHRTYRLTLLPNFDAVSVPSPDSNPYPGLASFSAADRIYFSGRNEDLGALIANLENKSPLVLLLGASGIGKSSLVAAGLVPHYERECRYSCHTIDCARADTLQSLEQKWLRSLTPSANVSGGGHLLIIDHLEKLLDTVESSESIDSLVQVLRTALAIPKVRVVALLRSDWYPRLIEFPALVALLRENTTQLLANLPAAELREVVMRPARLAGLTFELSPNGASLADQILVDAQGGRDQLPLLSVLLAQLYELRTSANVLTFEAYERLGTFSSCLARHAEQSLTELSDSDRAALPRVSLALLRISERGVTGRPRPLRTFDAEDRPLIEHFIKRRLLTTWSDGGTVMIAYCHDALVRNWPTLTRLIDSHKAHVLLREELTQSAQRWSANDCSRDFHLAPGPLANARRVEADPHINLSASEIQLIAASDSTYARARRVRNVVTTALVALCIAALASASLLLQERQAVRTAERRAAESFEVLQQILRTTEPAVAARAGLEPARFLDHASQTLATGHFAPAVHAEVALTLAEIYQQQWRLSPVEALLADARAQSELVPEDLALAARVLTAEGKLAYNRNNYTLAKERYLSALQAIANSPDQRSLLATIKNNLGELHLAQGAFAEGIAAHSEALKIRRTLFPDGNQKVGESLQNLAGGERANGQLENAEQHYREAIVMQRQALGEEHPEVATAISNLSVLLMSRGRLDEAQALADDAWAIRRQVFGDQHPQTANSLHNVASLAVQRGDYARAVPLLQRSIETHQDLFGEQHIAVAAGMNNLGKAYIAQGQYESACEILARAIARFEQADPPNPLAAYFYYNLAAAELKTERGEDALQSVQTAIARLPADHADQALFRTLQGSVLAELGKNFDSRRLFLDALRDVQASRGTQSDAYSAAYERASSYFRRVNDVSALNVLAALEPPRAD